MNRLAATAGHDGAKASCGEAVVIEVLGIVPVKTVVMGMTGWEGCL